MTKRRGLLLLWVEIAAAILLLLAGSALALVAGAARSAAEGERQADMTLLAEETLETMKYNERFRRALALPSEAERNGLSYQVAAARYTRTIGGLSFAAAEVTVTAPDGESLTLRTLLAPAVEEEVLPEEGGSPEETFPPEAVP